MQPNPVTAEPSPTISEIVREAAEAASQAAGEAQAEAIAAFEELQARIDNLATQVKELRERNATLETALANANDSWFNAQAELERLQNEAETRERLSESALGTEGLTGEDAATMQAMFDVVNSGRRMAERAANAEATAQQLRDLYDGYRIELGKARYAGTRGGANVAEEPRAVERPSDYHNVEEVESYLRDAHAGMVVLSPAARKTLADGLYSDGDRIFDMLDLLGAPHYAMMTGVAGAKKSFDECTAQLRVKYGPALRKSSYGEHGRHYEAQGLRGEKIGVERILHVRDNGTTFAPERMAALYFYWDDEQKATVVTSGPRKLPTNADYS